MKIKEVEAKTILNSRGEETIEIQVNGCITSAPSGKSIGKYEKPAYKESLKHDVDFVNNLKIKTLPEFKEFEDLEKIEKILKGKIGANTLYALEASILKSWAAEQDLELWEVLNPTAKIFPRILSNIIGGGVHFPDISIKNKPDFQEFLITCNKDPSIAVIRNNKATEEAGKILEVLMEKKPAKNYENAWVAELSNEQVLEVMKNVQENIFEETQIHMDIGIDCASTQFYKNGKYYYKNKKVVRSKKEQIKYIVKLAKKYNLFYIEDPLEEDDFKGFAEIRKSTNCLIVGDDLTATNLERVKKAIENKSINALIVKPNQTGSLIEVKRIIDLCKKEGIRTIMSHRSGETLDNTIADLAFAWQCEFIKVPVVGEEREVKVKRLIEIENSLKK